MELPDVTLAPAYDLTYAKGHGFTRTHQMTLGGKAERITKKDLLGLGRQMGIKHDGAHVLQQVVEARGEWKRCAEEAGVPRDLTNRIAAEFPRL